MEIIRKNMLTVVVILLLLILRICLGILVFYENEVFVLNLKFSCCGFNTGRSE